MKSIILKRENILIIVPLLFCFYIYFIKNDNPNWVLTFKGISESLESAVGFCIIWWIIFIVPFFQHLQLRIKNIASLMRWLHILFSVLFVAIFYWLFFEKTGIIPGWHTTLTPFNFTFGTYKISVFNFMIIACTLSQLFFILYFRYTKTRN